MIGNEHDLGPGAEPPSRLMIPGPVPLSPACAEELARPVEAHYGPAWAEVHRETVELLRRALGTGAADVFPLVGSGSTGLDAAIGSLVEPGDRVVVGVNGYFGQRLAVIARGHGAEVIEVPGGWGDPIAPDRIEAALRTSQPIAAVLVTHVETSTGVCNPVPELAAAARRHAIPILVDAVSSAGGMSLAMDDWGVDICVTASQKCFGGPAGLAPVAVGPRAWEVIERARSPRGWYLDLRTWREYADREADWHPAPVTMPTNVMRSFRQGLRELMAEGIEGRAARMRELGARLRRGVRGVGLALLADDAWAAPVVTAIRSPQGVSSAEIVRWVERSSGIRIAGGGLGPLGDSLFRVGHMAPITTDRDIDDVVAALEAFARSVRAAG